jgi:hypothetical protein
MLQTVAQERVRRHACPCNPFRHDPTTLSYVLAPRPIRKRTHDANLLSNGALDVRPVNRAFLTPPFLGLAGGSGGAVATGCAQDATGC